MLYEHAKRFGLTTLVETGTYKGAMVAAMRPFFEDIISVELSEPLYADAARRFADDSRISIMQGDSATVLPRVLSSLQAGALFWLDAHCSGGETAGVPSSPPVDDELRLIVRHRPDHVVLIDDTHYLGETAQAVAARFGVIAPPPRWRVSVKDDVVRVLPAQPT